MIRILEYRRLKEATKNRSLGYFVEVETGKSINVGRDEHWDWARYNIEKLLPDISKEDQHVYMCKILGDDLIRITREVSEKWIRVRIFGDEFQAQVYKTTEPYYKAIMGFLQKYLNRYPQLSTIYVDTYDEIQIWDDVSLDRALTSKSFNRF